MADTADKTDLGGKHLLVTGANRGIGRAFVDEALRRGARVFAAARRPETLRDLVAEHGDRVVCLLLDLAEPASIEAFAQRCPELDLVIHNAGASLPGRVLDVADADVRQLFEVNFFGPLDLLRRLRPQLVQRAAQVLIVSSLSGLMLSRSAPAYSASKAALTMAALGMRTQLAGDGVQVSVLFPGFVDTDMTAAMTVAKASAADVAARTLDGVAAGELAIFPDRYAQIVAEALQDDYAATLRNAQAVADAAVARFTAGD